MPLSEPEARDLAEAWLREHVSFPVKTVRAAETERSWIFPFRGAGGELLVGNPLIVDKRSGAISTHRAVWRELVVRLGTFDRIARWWHRNRTY